MTISLKTHKRLWTRAGDECAFPSCAQPLLAPLENDTEEDTLIGKECHIVAQSDDGPRGPATLTVEERSRWKHLIDNRDGYANLVLMCGVHHDIIDGDVSAYPIQRLVEIKQDHDRAVQSRRSRQDRHRDALDIRYAAIVDEWSERVDLNAWDAHLSRLVSDGVVARAYLERLEAARWWLLNRVWPRTLPDLEAAFHAFRHVAEDLDLIVNWFSTERHGQVFVDRVYKEVTGDRTAQVAFLRTRSTYYNDLAADLTLELTRVANLICERVREHLWADYRLSEGRTAIGIGMDSSLAYRVVIPQYPVDALGGVYPGLHDFVVQRADRDLHFGEGPPPKGAGLPGMRADEE